MAEFMQMKVSKTFILAFDERELGMIMDAFETLPEMCSTGEAFRYKKIYKACKTALDSDRMDVGTEGPVLDA